MKPILLLSLLVLPWTLLAEEQDPPEPNYVYWAKLVRIVDGNTLALDIDLGFDTWVHNRAITLSNSGGDGMTEDALKKNMERVKLLRELLDDPTDIVIQTTRDREANPPRYLAEVWVDGVHLNEELKKAFP